MGLDSHCPRALERFAQELIHSPPREGARCVEQDGRLIVAHTVLLVAPYEARKTR
jgi:hypothetical protein